MRDVSAPAAFEAADPDPSLLPTGREWVTHSEENLLPNWTTPAALDNPVDNFTTFRDLLRPASEAELNWPPGQTQRAKGSSSPIIFGTADAPTCAARAVLLAGKRKVKSAGRFLALQQFRHGPMRS
jgi:hypothetical protein